MARAHSSGFPHIGADPELREAVDAYRQGDIDQPTLRAVGKDLRARHWAAQSQAGLEWLAVGDFAWYDPVLGHSLAFGVVPQRFAGTCDSRGLPTLDTLLAMANGASAELGTDHSDAQQEQEATQRFDSHYPCVAPQFSAEQRFKLSWEQLFEEVDEAMALGHKVKPVVLGPLTFLWLGTTTGATFDKLDLLERLLPVYGEILGRLAAKGVEWVQIDEPILTLELPQAWKNAFERAYHMLQYSPLKKLVSTGIGGLEGNLGLAVGLPVDGLHVDLMSAPEQLAIVLDRLPSYKVLSLGVVDGRDQSRCDLQQVLAQLQLAEQRFGENLWVASSHALLHRPLKANREHALDASFKGWLAFAVQKCNEIALLARAISNRCAAHTKPA